MFLKLVGGIRISCRIETPTLGARPRHRSMNQCEVEGIQRFIATTHWDDPWFRYQWWYPSPDSRYWRIIATEQSLWHYSGWDSHKEEPSFPTLNKLFCVQSMDCHCEKTRFTARTQWLIFNYDRNSLLVRLLFINGDRKKVERQKMGPSTPHLVHHLTLGSHPWERRMYITLWHEQAFSDMSMDVYSTVQLCADYPSMKTNFRHQR